MSAAMNPYMDWLTEKETEEYVLHLPIRPRPDTHYCNTCKGTVRADFYCVRTGRLGHVVDVDGECRLYSCGPVIALTEKSLERVA